ncbi:MAG: hypothetical protein PHH71_02760 [Clostridia bacterium]|nr:hypothetical protein [Clostridia bacterium]
MNWSILLFSAVSSGLLLWLSAKFFGKIGIYCFAMLQFALSLTIAYSIGSANVFGVAVPVALIHLFTAIFIFYIFYKKYAFKEVLKLIVISGCFTVALGLTAMLYYSYSFNNFTFAFNFALAPMLIVLGAFLVAITVGFLIDTKTNFVKDFTFKSFISLLGAMFAAILIFNIASQAGIFAFGDILLSLLISLLVALLFGIILFFLEGFFTVRPDDITSKQVQTANKQSTKNIMFSKPKATQNKVDKKRENSEIFEDDGEYEEEK